MSFDHRLAETKICHKENCMKVKRYRSYVFAASGFVVMGLIASGYLIVLHKSTTAANAAAAKEPAAIAQASAQAAYGKLPLSFESNRGQTDSQVQFLARGNGYALFLTPNEAVLELRKLGIRNDKSLGASAKSNNPQSAVLRMRLAGASAEPKAAGLDELPGKSNYFLGNDPKQW